MKEFKIDPARLGEYTKRNDGRVLKILVITMLSMPFLMYPMTQMEGFPKEVAWAFLGSLLFTTLIVGSIYVNNKKMTRLSAENLVIRIDDSSITRTIDLDNEPRMNFLHKYGYKRAKSISGGYDARIEFSDLKSIETKKGDLWVRSKSSYRLDGKNIVLVPRELLGYEEVESLLKEKLK